MTMRPDKDSAISRLERQLKEIEYIKDAGHSQNLDQWKRNTEVALRYIFGDESRHVSEFTLIRYTPAMVAVGNPNNPQMYRDARGRGLEHARALLKSMIEEVEEYWDAKSAPLATAPPVITSKSAYIDPTRIAELHAIPSPNFDLTKLIQLCEEINRCDSNDCFMAVGMLARTILDHVPPIFGAKNFPEVANNYSGSKSFKQSMQHLESSSRKIADAHLHTQIRSKEVLPNKTQVNFSNDIDVLLAEIIRILK